MSKLFKFITLAVVPLLVIFLFLLFFNTLLIDFKYAHKSLRNYQAPFNWALYKFEINLLKIIKNIKNNKQIGLEKKLIYLSEKSQKKLISDVPISTKKWQQGFFYTKDNELKKIKIRYRGDNPRNWLFEKKSWRIKTRKKDQFGQFRYYDYNPFVFAELLSGNIASRTKVISPKFNLIELYVNDISQGIYIQTEKINENFLRRNKIMPVNIYKGEQINSEAIIGTNNNLFNNPILWKKTAVFNKFKKSNNKDLLNFLNLLRKSENNKYSYKKLIRMLDFKEWGQFAAYQILTNNYHNDYGHNMRMILDPWSGKVRPIIIDPILGDNIYKNNRIDFDYSSHDLLLLLNKNSLFLDTKYKELFNLISKDKIITNGINNILNLEKKILISEKRDIELQRNVFNDLNFKQKINPLFIFRLSDIKKRNLSMEKLNLYNNRLLEKILSKPKSSWSNSINGFNINIDGDIPISNLKIFYKKDIPTWISIDLNGNLIHDDNEKFTSNENGIFNIPLTLYANRTSATQNKNKITEPAIITSNTKFEFLVNNSTLPNKIEVQNPFSLEVFRLDIDNSLAVPRNKFNLPIIYNSFTKKITKTFEGVIKVKKNLLIKNMVNIKPGTQFLLDKGVNIVFLDKVIALGSPKNPIIFKKMNNNISSDNNWGSVVLQGHKTKNSRLENIIFDGGSGSQVDQFIYTSMFSLHDTKDIVLRNITLINNKIYDDAVHLVYCKNILLDNLVIKNAFSDALDIDISDNILIKNSMFKNPKNDSIDIMESKVLIDSTEINSSGDKGISVGENSKVLIHNTYLYKNNIALAVKDGSVAKVFYTDFNNNALQVSGYQKNYKYGKGGNIEIFKSSFQANNNNIKSDLKSNIYIDDSVFNQKIIIKKSNIKLSNKVNFDNNKDTLTDFNKNNLDEMFSLVKNVKNTNLRGSDFINK